MREISLYQELFESVEQHSEQDRAIEVEYYKRADGSFFVWPSVRHTRGNSDSRRHFEVLGEFPNKETARNAVLIQGRMLIASGWI
jgi:hypothetical protein